MARRHIHQSGFGGGIIVAAGGVNRRLFQRRILNKNKIIIVVKNGIDSSNVVAWFKWRREEKRIYY